jgi:hypothetical protein
VERLRAFSGEGAGTVERGDATFCRLGHSHAATIFCWYIVNGLRASISHLRAGIGQRRGLFAIFAEMAISVDLAAAGLGYLCRLYYCNPNIASTPPASFFVFSPGCLPDKAEAGRELGREFSDLSSCRSLTRDLCQSIESGSQRRS